MSLLSLSSEIAASSLFSEDETYTQQGDYLLPDLKLPEQPKVEIGILGAGVRWTPLPQAEAPTEPTGETSDICDTSKITIQLFSRIS